MKAKKNVAQKGKSPNPLPKEKTGSIGSQERTLSKDELIDALDRSLRECVDSAEPAINKNVPVLLFLAKALDQDEPMDELILHMQGRDVDYCHSGNAVGQILQWMATELYEASNKIDAAEMEVWGETERLRKGRLKAANSR